MHEEVLCVLARLPFAVPVVLQFIRQLYDLEIEITQRGLVHVRNARIVDIIQNIDILGQLAEKPHLVLRQLGCLTIRPADMIARISASHVQRIRRTGTDDELLPFHLHLFPAFVISFHLSGIYALLGLGISGQKVPVSEKEVFRLLSEIKKTNIAQRLIYLSPSVAVGSGLAIVVEIHRIIVIARYLVALAFLVGRRDVIIERFEAKLVTEVLRDPVAKPIQFLLRELSRLPYLYGNGRLSWNLLDIRLRLAVVISPLVLQQRRREFPRNPFYGLWETEAFSLLDNLNRSPGLVVRTALVLDKPDSVLAEHSGRRVLVILPDTEVLASGTAEAGGALRIVMRDYRLASVCRIEYVFFLDHS